MKAYTLVTLPIAVVIIFFLGGGGEAAMTVDFQKLSSQQVARKRL
jgi:hypothetical protein